MWHLSDCWDLKCFFPILQESLSFNTHIRSAAQFSRLWSHITVCPLETSFTEQHSILTVHDPSSYHLYPLIMQFISLVFPLISCGGLEESKLPLPINPFGAWARIEFTCVEFPWKFQPGGVAV